MNQLNIMLVINVEWLNLTKQITISNQELIKSINAMDNDDKMQIVNGIAKTLKDNPEILCLVLKLMDRLKSDELTILQKGLIKKTLKNYL